MSESFSAQLGLNSSHFEKVALNFELDLVYLVSLLKTVVITILEVHLEEDFELFHFQFSEIQR